MSSGGTRHCRSISAISRGQGKNEGERAREGEGESQSVKNPCNSPDRSGQAVHPVVKKKFK